MLGISFPAHAAEKKLVGYACISEFSRYAKQISLHEYKNGIRCYDPKKDRLVSESKYWSYYSAEVARQAETSERLVEIWENVDG